METAPSVTPSQASQQISMPLWDVVKTTLYDYWRENNRLLTQIDANRIDAAGERDVEVDKITVAFRAGVLALYRGCEKKWIHFEVPGWNGSEGQEDIKKLPMKDYKKNPQLFTLQIAIVVFGALTEFLELDGITHYEKKSVDSLHCAVEDLD